MLSVDPVLLLLLLSLLLLLLLLLFMFVSRLLPNFLRSCLLNFLRLLFWLVREKTAVS